MATIADVAREANVSISTVSKVMNHRRDVSAATRAKVRQVIERLDYHPDSAAKGLRTKRSMMIAAIVRYLDHDYFQQAVAGIENASYARDYNVVICNCQVSEEREWALVKLFMQRRVDGLIFVVPMMKDADLVKLSKKGIRMAIIGAPVVGDLQAPVVMADHVQGGYDAVMHLLREHGKRRVAYIQGAPEQNHGFLGYCKALKDFGLAFAPELVGYGGHSVETAGAALEKMFLLGHAPDAVMCFNDELALGVYQQAKKMGLRIPEDIAVVGVDDTRFGRCLSPALATVQVPAFDMGRLAANELIDLLEGKNDRMNRRTLPTRLITRGSCGCPDPDGMPAAHS